MEVIADVGSEQKPIGEPTKPHRHPNSLKNLLRDHPNKLNPPETFGESRPDMYEAMVHVLSQPKSADRTPIQKEARAWLKANRNTFIAKYADFQKLRGDDGKSKPGQDESDAGTAKSVELAEKLIEELS